MPAKHYSREIGVTLFSFISCGSCFMAAKPMLFIGSALPPIRCLCLCTLSNILWLGPQYKTFILLEMMLLKSMCVFLQNCYFTLSSDTWQGMTREASSSLDSVVL